MRRVSSPGLPATAFGVHGPMLAICFAVGVSAVAAYPMWSVFDGAFGLRPYVIGMWMLGALAVAYAVWSLLATRRWVTGATGAGFPLAACGLGTWFTTLTLEGLLPSYGRIALAGEGVYAELDLARGLAVVAFVTGLAFVVIASIGKRVVRTHAPDWTLPH